MIPNRAMVTQYGGAVFTITHVDKKTVTVHFREHLTGGTVWTVLSKADARAIADVLKQAAEEGAE